MTSPRLTRLHRAADLRGFRAGIADLVRVVAPAEAADTFILVPTRAAGEQLRRTLEDRLLAAPGDAIAMPRIGTRGDLYVEAGARLAPPPRLLTPFEREVLLAASARAAVDEGMVPPFTVRPGLIAEMLALYDQVRRLARTVDDFDRNLRLELEPDADADRGAARLLEQTAFFAATFSGYEARLGVSDGLDEHAARQRLVAEPLARPLSRVIVTVADRTADPDGLWPADFLMLSRLQGLAHLDIVATEALLGAGLLERLYGALPGIDETKVNQPPARLPTLRTPPPSSPGASAPDVFHSRDREEELAQAARRFKHARRNGPATALHRTALVVRKPLPYLYLARDVFGGAGIPFETLDTLPLAAEPYAAAVDLVLEAAASDFTRTSLLALLRSPHFRLPDESGAEPAAASVRALDVALSEARYLGGLDRLEGLAAEWHAPGAPANRDERRRVDARSAASAACAASRPLAPLATERRIVEHIADVIGFLRTFDRPPGDGDPDRSRRLRVRSAVFSALESLADAYRRHDPSGRADLPQLSAAIRRWLGSQTFALPTGGPGLQIVDAQAARFGEFDDVQLVGLIDGEWPEKPRRSVLYPASLLSSLEPAPLDPRIRERQSLNGARASFRDLLALAATDVRVSTVLLENDAVVEPSPLLDEIAAVGLPKAPDAPLAAARIFQHEALSTEPQIFSVLAGGAAEWGEVRLRPRPGTLARFRGEVGPWVLPRVSVSRLERFLNCPFRFYASEVLRLEEEPEDEDTRTPLERGRFLHELFERFFTEWQKRGHHRITPGTLDSARALFHQLCEDALATLSPSEAAIERPRLLGSAVSAGIGHRVLSMEADRASDVVERLLEYPLEGEFAFKAADGHTRLIALNGKADRIDLLADGTLRVIDYKSKKTPNQRTALQLPVYSLCAQQQLAGHAGRDWRVSEAMYLSFEGDKAVDPLRARGKSIGDLLDESQDRLLTTLDAIAAGSFPPSPERRALCGPCPYQAVCRKEWVEVETSDE